jgi:hypothetical protein
MWTSVLKNDSTHLSQLIGALLHDYMTMFIDHL